MNKGKILTRIDFLLQNPVLAVKSLNGGDNYFSNCHGTVAYVLGVEDIFEKMAQRKEDFVYAKGRPACMDRDLMKAFLEKECKLVKDNYRFGDIATFWSNVHRRTADMPEIRTREAMQKILDLPPVKTIEHSAVLIEPENEQVFHQQETGREFELNTIDKYISQWFPDFRGRGINLFVDFYRLKDSR